MNTDSTNPNSTAREHPSPLSTTTTTTTSETIPTKTSAASKKQHQTKESKPYDELKIKDGPIYNWTTLKETKPRSSSNGLDNDGFSITDSMLSELSSSSPMQPSSMQSPPLPAESTALLIVDVQPEYWSNCPIVRRDFPDFPKHLHKTIKICRQRRAKIIWVRADYRHKHSPWLTQFERIRGTRNPGEVYFDPSSPEFTWEEFATPEGGEVVIAKSSWSSCNNTALVDILKTACIETVLVCGLITSVCVQHSAFGVFEAGYRTLLVTDACADRGRARHEAALALYGDYMYELVKSDNLESKTTGLIPAQPVWLVLDEKTNMVRANSFPKQVLAVSTSSGTLSTTSSSNKTTSSSDDEEKTTSSTINGGVQYKITNGNNYSNSATCSN